MFDQSAVICNYNSGFFNLCNQYSTAFGDGLFIVNHKTPLWD